MKFQEGQEVYVQVWDGQNSFVWVSGCVVRDIRWGYDILVPLFGDANYYGVHQALYGEEEMRTPEEHAKVCLTQ